MTWHDMSTRGCARFRPVQQHSVTPPPQARGVREVEGKENRTSSSPTSSAPAPSPAPAAPSPPPSALSFLCLCFFFFFSFFLAGRGWQRSKEGERTRMRQVTTAGGQRPPNTASTQSHWAPREEHKAAAHMHYVIMLLQELTEAAPGAATVSGCRERVVR